jgi:hypothetical protein
MLTMSASLTHPPAAAPHPPGAYFGLPSVDYHADPSLGGSDLKRLLRSPSDYWFESHLNPDRPPERDTPPCRRAAPCTLVLEGEEAFAKAFAQAPEPAARRSCQPRGPEGQVPRALRDERHQGKACPALQGQGGARGAAWLTSGRPMRRRGRSKRARPHHLLGRRCRSLCARSSLLCTSPASASPRPLPSFRSTLNYGPAFGAAAISPLCAITGPAAAGSLSTDSGCPAFRQLSPQLRSN